MQYNFYWLFDLNMILNGFMFLDSIWYFGWILFNTYRNISEETVFEEIVELVDIRNNYSDVPDENSGMED